jgi:hypothetical protein
MRVCQVPKSHSGMVLRGLSIDSVQIDFENNYEAVFSSCAKVNNEGLKFRALGIEFSGYKGPVQGLGLTTVGFRILNGWFR